MKHHGLRPVIVERAPELRTGGQSVDVRGAGQEVVRRMNLEQAIRARTTREAASPSWRRGSPRRRPGLVSPSSTVCCASPPRLGCAGSSAGS
ncbi:hypothetical protein [Archangium sp.]|uniref:hypothetical protein n=1 Tax=Archangium sp. TaxID=1872627 RepID=UPI00286CF96C|nr:hypothetical protein [Archangium sp.]